MCAWVFGFGLRTGPVTSRQVGVSFPVCVNVGVVAAGLHPAVPWCRGAVVGCRVEVIMHNSCRARACRFLSRSLSLCV